MIFRRFEDVAAWSKARVLHKTIARAVLTWPQCRYLAEQIQRAALSIMSNVAEGFESNTDREFARFLRIARRSATGIQSHAYAAEDLDLISGSCAASWRSNTREIKAIITRLSRHLTRAPR